MMHQAMPPGPYAGAVPVQASLARLCGITVSILLLLSVLGYPVVGVGGSLYFIENRDFAIAFRVGVLAYAAYGMGLALTQLPAQTMRFLPPAVTAFFILYSIRLIADNFTGLYPDLGQTALYFYGTCVIPAIAVCMLSAFRDPRRDARLFLVLGAALCAAILLTSLAGITGVVDPAEEMQGRLNLARLNAISIGHIGVTTVLAGVALYFEPGHPRWLRWLILPACGVAIACLIYSGSRGPFVSLVGALMAVLVFQRRWKLLGAVVVAAAIWAIQATSFEGALVDRLLALGSDQSSLVRLDLQYLAFAEFLDNPVTGSAYVETISGFYPHNLLLESAMALGVVGFGLMAWIMVRAGITAIRRMNEGELMLPLLVFQYLLAVLFSGAITSSNEFWICVALILADSRRQRMASAPAPAIPRAA
jgi:hypothetical protein